MKQYDDPAETWRTIEGHTLYQVSNLGRVRSIDYTTENPRFPGHYRRHAGRVLKQGKGPRGYVFVSIFDDARRKYITRAVHRLVARAFCPGYEPGKDVNHKDENTSNNRASNLEYITRRENINYGTANVRRSYAVKYRHPVNAYTPDGLLYGCYPSVRRASKLTGTRPHAVRNCASGREHYKTAGGLVWKFAGPLGYHDDHAPTK